MFGSNWFSSKESRWREFEATALQFRPDLYRMAMWLAHDPVDAEDLVQETFFQAMRSFHLFERGTNCKAWLARILYIHNARRLRTMLKLQLVYDADDTLLARMPAVPVVSERVSDETILAAISCLPETFRNVLVLSDIEELSYKEISSVLQIPVGTVMSRLSRARKILRTELADHAQQYGIGLTKAANQ